MVIAAAILIGWFLLSVVTAFLVAAVMRAGRHRATTVAPRAPSAAAPSAAQPPAVPRQPHREYPLAS